MDYNKELYNLHQRYIEQLDKTMDQYPPYKVGEPNSYTRELSLLNGITKDISDLQTTIVEKTKSMSRVIQSSDTAINQIKQIEKNLLNYTGMDDLDITSKQMLEDSKEEYSEYRIIFFVKLAVAILILINLVYIKKYILVAVFIILSFALAFLSNILLDMTSR